MSFSSQQLFHEHKDLIHHISYDLHGKRIATCSSDQSVTIWDLNSNNVWQPTTSWKVNGDSLSLHSSSFTDTRWSRLESDLGASRIWSNNSDVFI